jgi:hypothetical protein
MIVSGLFLFSLITCSTLFAQQNLIVNGTFQSGNTGFNSDYTYVVPQNTNGQSVGIEAGKYTIDISSTGHGIGSIGWPSISGYGGSNDKFLMANGWGNNENSSKAVWKQTVNVTPNTPYTFSCKVVSLLTQVMQWTGNPCNLQLKINSVPVGNSYQPSTHRQWIDWIVPWSGSNSSQAVIEIVDLYNGTPDLGDDFGLDNISFVPDVVYSVMAYPDACPLACPWTPIEIPILENDIISPGIQGLQVTMANPPSYGDWSVVSYSNTKKIEYIYQGNSPTGTDQFKYRIGYPDQNVYSEAWVTVTVGETPLIANISAPSAICAGGPLGIPTPIVTPDAPGHWEYSSSQNGTYQTFDPTNVQLSMNGKYVRYSASNDCGEGHSNAVQITVTNGPSFTGQTPTVQPICAGQSLNLTPPAYNTNGSQVSNPGWVASPTENGNYTAFSLTNIPATYNGWYIRYKIEGSCGTVYSQPARQLTVNVAPSNVGALTAPDAICAGDDLEVTAPTFDGTGNGAWEICQTQNGTYQSFSIQNVPATYNNWYLHYKVSNNCGSATSNAVQIHVNDAPTIATPTTPSAICAGGSFNLVAPSIQNNGFSITDQGWQIASTQNGTYNSFNNNNVQYSSNGYWIRYYAVNECGETHSASVQVTVNDEPVVGDIAVPAGICEGQSFNLTAPTVQWRHTNQGTGSWEIQVNGVWQTLNNSNIPFAYNGCNIRYKAVNGCGTNYSSNVVQVTVYSTQPVDLGDVTFCQEGYFHNVWCSQDGHVYGYDSLTPNNCTIHVSWLFHLSEDYNIHPQTQTECNEFYWPQTGITYYNSGVYYDTVSNSNPVECDDVYILNLTINNAPEILENLEAPPSVCVGSPLAVNVPQYSMNHPNGDAHWEYATSANGPFVPFDPSVNNLSYGTYYLRYAVSNECGNANSNVVTFHVNDVPEANMQLSAMQVCEGETLTLPTENVVWHNDNENDRVAQWQMSPTQNGTYAPIDPSMPMQASHSGNWLRFVAQNSCGSDIVGPVMITVVTSEDQWLDPITACDVYMLESGQVITESTVVDYEVLEPCFHVNHQPIIINHSNYVVEPITSCHDEFEWHGMTFYRSEQTQYASVSLTNVYGCDSVVELQLDFGDYAKVTEQRFACNFYEWPRKPGSYYTESQQDSLFIPGNDAVCDSIIYLDLSLGQTYELEGDPMFECSGFVWHGVPYYEDAIVYDSLQTVGTHCDSIIAYQLTIIPPIENDTSMVSCHAVWWNGHYFENEGDEYTHVYVSQYGCDSIVTMHFSLAEVIEQHVDTVACDPFDWYGHHFEGDGQSSHTFQTLQGCDSMVYLNVTFNQAEIQSNSVSACNSYVVDGVVYDQPGFYQIYYDTVYSPNGCIGSVQLLNLTINDSELMGAISGSANVFVASNIISGIYRYEVDAAGVEGDIIWTISNPDWQIVEAQDYYCLVFVGTPGSATLTARFNTSDCGEMEREFIINAGFFDVNEHAFEVKIFPNPTKGSVTIEAEGIEAIRLTNMMGQVLDSCDYGRSDSVMLNLTGYAPSVYLIEIKTVNGLVKKRLVLCR